MQHYLNKTSAVSYYFSSWHFIYFDEDLLEELLIRFWAWIWVGVTIHPVRWVLYVP